MSLNITTKDGRPIDLGSPEAQGWIKFGLIVFIGVFCLWGTKTLLSKALYQQKIISIANKSINQLNINAASATTLSNQYTSLFENSNSINFLGGKNDSSPQAAPPDVDNARLALDALPTTYDYPALLASVTKIMNNNAIFSPSIQGTDQTVTTSSTPSATPQPVPIKLSITGTGAYASVQNVLKDMERSIRPFDVTSLQLSGSENSLTFTISVTTYFQPAKVLGITQSEVQ